MSSKKINKIIIWLLPYVLFELKSISDNQIQFILVKEKNRMKINMHYHFYILPLYKFCLVNGFNDCKLLCDEKQLNLHVIIHLQLYPQIMKCNITMNNKMTLPQNCFMMIKLLSPYKRKNDCSACNKDII